MAKSKGELPPGEPVPEKQYPTGHEGGNAFNEDQRGGHTPSPEKFTAADEMEKKSEPQPESAKPPVRRKLDPELKAMDAVCEILEELDPAMQGRVLAWACQKFKIYPSGVIMHIAEAKPAPEINLR